MGLLSGQVLIHGHKNIEFFLCEVQQSAIAIARPTHFSNGSNVVAGKLSF